ncbi:MAG: glycosyltransferase family 9 protein, partial [Chloroflexi bacterium]|nr:glycosyltransferase family 9 protein [Chloroflexota bacterium]
PPDSDRTAVTQRLIDKLNWLGDRPLVVMHPGGGDGTTTTDNRKQWPLERFVLLGNHIVRKHNAQVILVGGEQDREIVTSIAGMMFAKVGNWAGQFSLGSLGALAEIADLYIGNDTGPTHIAAAVGCPTLAIFGPSDPAISGPYGHKENVTSLWRGQSEQPFSWENGISVEEATRAADNLLS